MFLLVYEASLNFPLNDFLQSKIMPKLSSLQKITHIIVLVDKKNNCSLSICIYYVSSSFLIKYFLQLGCIFCWNLPKKRENVIRKKQVNVDWILRDVSLPFLLPGTFKCFLESYWFYQYSGSDINNRGQETVILIASLWCNAYRNHCDSPLKQKNFWILVIQINILILKKPCTYWQQMLTGCYIG